MRSRPRLILASASARRRDLLGQIGIAPDAVVPADIDESRFESERPRDYVARLSAEKAAKIAAERPEGELILAADTTVAVGRRILEKPNDEAEARAFLALMSGRRHRVFTGVALVRTDDQRSWSRVVETQVSMKRLSAEETDFYIASGEWRGKAGGYGIQGLAERFIPWMAGSYSNVVGLPLTETAGLLLAAGYPVDAP